MNWTDERVELLKKLWSEGLSASQIAAQLGGISRNAVIGKVHRLKLSGRGRATKPVQRTRKTTAVNAAPRATTVSATQSSGGGSSRTTTRSVGSAALKVEFVADAIAHIETRPVEDVVVPLARHLNLLQLTECTCKWPVGDPLAEDFYFCGADSGEGSPYCGFHSKVAFQHVGDRYHAKAR